MSTSQEPAVSVIVPAHNVAKYLPRSVGSVKAQSFADHEIIVIDDASQDDPATAVRRLCANTRCLRLPTNKGVSAARNVGIRAARGEFIALLDADDYWEPEKLERQMATLRSDSGIDLVFGDFAHVMPDGSPGPWQGGMLQKLRSWGLTACPLAAEAYEIGGPIANELIKRISLIHPSTVVIRRSVFDRLGYFDEGLLGAEDLQMLIRIASNCRIAYVDRVLARVEQRADSLKHNNRLMAENTLKLYTALEVQCAQMPIDVQSAVRAQLAACHNTLAWIHSNLGEVKAARAHYLAAWRRRPSPEAALRVVKSLLPSAAITALRRIRPRSLRND